MSPRFFVDRPVLAGVLSIVIVLAGLLAMRARCRLLCLHQT